MADTLVPVALPPGVFRNGTQYQAKGRWNKSHLVRFYSGSIEPIGGWRTAQSDTGSDIPALTGVPRGALSWRGLNGDQYVAIGTTQKLYVIVDGTRYDITPVGFTAGAADTTSSTGAYGAGLYGGGAYGAGAVTSAMHDADVWTLDSFGDYLLATSPSDSKLYIWLGVPANPAIPVDMSAATGAPTGLDAVAVTPERFIFALGTANQRRVTWPDQAGYATWGPLVTNSAGSWDLATDGRIMAGQRTKNETLIWTDVDVHAARYVGGVGLYRFDQVGDKCGLISRRAKVVVDTMAFWMGKDNFFMYDGYTHSLPSEVHDYVFGDFNFVQAAKVWALSVAQFGEVWWFYPSAHSLECDRYVVFNYREGHWTTGQLPRSAGIDAGVTQYPIMLDTAGRVYEHEIQQERAASAFGEAGNPLLTEDGFALLAEDGVELTMEQTAPFLESGPIEVGEGDRLISIQRLVPDEKTLGDVSATVFSSLFPTATEVKHGPYSLENPTPVRITARQIRLRYEEARPTDWRVGVTRLGIRPSSRR